MGKITEKQNSQSNERVTIIFADTSRTAYLDLASLAYVTAKDREYADRFVKESDKVAHLASAYLKRKYVGEWTLTESGKPVADGKFFNVSHCDGAVVLALANRDVGVDVENVRKADEDLKRYVSSDEEYWTINADKDFFKVWTSKESLAKADGEGLDGRVKDIPALPLAGCKEFKGEKYFSRLTEFENFAISVTKKGEEPFDILIKKEKIK